MSMKTNYIDNADLMEEWQRWVSSGNSPETRTISDNLARMMTAIANRILTSRSFGGYPIEVREDMAGESVLKMIRNLKNYKSERGTLFSYLSRIVFCACATYLRRHYRRKNAEREIALSATESQPQTPRRRAFVHAMRQKVEEYR